MKIRRAKENDKEKILELLNEDPGNTADDELHYNLNHVNEYVNGKAFETFVCEIDGKIAGIAMANVFPLGKYAEMYNAVVDIGYRRKGIGIKLLDFLENHLKKSGIKIIYGYVNDGNKPSEKMLEKLGYQKGKKVLFYSKVLRK